MYGYETMLEYVNNQKRFVRNDKPIVGLYNVNKKGSTMICIKRIINATYIKKFDK